MSNGARHDWKTWTLQAWKWKGGVRICNPNAAQTINSAPLEVQFAKCQHFRRLGFIRLGQSAVVITEVSAAAQYVIHQRLLSGNGSSVDVCRIGPATGELIDAFTDDQPIKLDPPVKIQI